MKGRVHIVGAGLSGLACAVWVASRGAAVTLYEAAGHAGGRCRSYRDPVLDREIDTGNHLILSGNRSMLAYLDECGAADLVWGPKQAIVPFADLKSGAQWAIRPNAGKFPWWLASRARRAPGGGLSQHLRDLMTLRRAGPEDTVAGLLGHSPLYPRFWRPVAVSILNTTATEASAALLWCAIEESLALGGASSRPLFPRRNLGSSFVDPALATLERLGGEVRFHERLRHIGRRDGHAVALNFAGGLVPLCGGDRVVLALPADATVRLLPHLPAVGRPFDHNPILNAHFDVGQPMPLPGGLPFLGLAGGEWAEWIFSRDGMLSVTLSAAQERSEMPADKIAGAVWREVRVALRLGDASLPAFRIIVERRATIAQTPAQIARRPGPMAAGNNILLAGDWTDTGLPCTIEGAIRSGHRAAELALAEVFPQPARAEWDPPN